MEAYRTIAKFVLAALTVAALAGSCAFLNKDVPSDPQGSSTLTAETDSELINRVMAVKAAEEALSQMPKDELDGTEID
jgi:hypothetical protein